MRRDRGLSIESKFFGVAAGLENVIETYDVTLDINVWVLDTVAYSCLGCEIDNDIELILSKQFIHQFTVSDGALDERPRISRIARMEGLEFFKSVFLQ